MFPDIEDIRQALVACDVSPLEIFKATDLTPAWQHAFASGRVVDPAYTKVILLVDYFNQTQHQILTKSKV